ncbi:hypothetical protein BRARA_J00005 [Brassica rapa]|uniref:PCI domain-containing protein n=1 Tax=Brassica campestris TaxID=3711 RepID=A0A397XH69_BRACM|nr:hypothetical protein BRARA_J00005 [Brassica rapa]
MEIEQKQAEIIGQLVDRASKCSGESMWPIYITSFSFRLFQDFGSPQLPRSCFRNVCLLEGTTHSVFLDVLRLFAHGTWGNYKCNDNRIPQLSPHQILKLKKLTLLPNSEDKAVLPYDNLMVELDVTNVRQLEDFLNNECMYDGIVRGKLDQLKRCFEVPFAAGRDPRPGELGDMLHALSNLLNTSENLLCSFQDKLKWADNMAEEGVEEVKRSPSMKGDVDNRGHKEMFGELSRVMDCEEDGIRLKRRRHLIPR